MFLCLLSSMTGVALWAQNGESPVIRLKSDGNVPFGGYMLSINAPEADRSSVWIDWNNNGVKDTDEEVANWESGDNITAITHEIDSKTFSIYGPINTLVCANNGLYELEISGNSHLESLICDNNNLSSLDCSKNTQLNNLSIRENPLYDIDVSMLVDSTIKCN